MSKDTIYTNADELKADGQWTPSLGQVLTGTGKKVRRSDIIKAQGLVVTEIGYLSPEHKFVVRATTSDGNTVIVGAYPNTIYPFSLNDKTDPDFLVPAEIAVLNRVRYASQAAQPENWKSATEAAMERHSVDIAKWLDAELAAGNIPLLLGPPGTSKTYTINRHLRALLEQREKDERGEGARQITLHRKVLEPAQSSANLTGLALPGNKTHYGVLYKAAMSAQAGNLAVVFLDEVGRANPDVIQALMQFADTTLETAADARDSGANIPEDYGDDKMVRVVSSLFLEDSLLWFPEDGVRIIFAGNPWGTDIDRAFINRCTPAYTFYRDDVFKPLPQKVREFARLVNKSYKEGKIDILPVSYRLIARMQDPEGKDLVREWYAQCMAYTHNEDTGQAAMIKAAKLEVPNITL